MLAWHPHGCNSNDDKRQLANPSNTATSPPCINNPFGWDPTNNPSGGWEIQKLPPGVSFQIWQGPPDGTICGPQLIRQVSQDGCYDVNNLANQVWWNFCTTGVDCAEPQPLSKRSTASGILKDEQGSYVIAANGDRVSVLFQEGLTLVTPAGPTARGIYHRQSTTWRPPSDCGNTLLVCKALADSGQLKATCIDCVQGFGAGVRASRDIDCRQQTSPCQITVLESVTVTDTISVDVSFGITFGDTGKDGASGDARFGFGASFSIATTHGQNLQLAVEPGHVGFLQYQPTALLGTVVSSIATNEFCNDVSHNICGAAPGALATSNDDSGGKYSIVLTS
ncbi:hypothetical protein GQ53DRAFT_863204 [Thozetella sp. PMI_491]|nr:hypothetical protein GQ53DRAFT_863204 [Thozetella sp. PMI_491]